MENVILLFALQLGRKYIYICCKNCTTHIQPKAMCTFLETSTFDLSFSFLIIPGVFSFLVFCTLSVSAQIYTPTLLFKVHVVGAFKKDQTVETGRQWRKNLQDNLQM